MEIGDSWRGWSLESLLGSSGYSEVYKIVCKNWGRSYVSALKVIEIPSHHGSGNAILNDLSYSSEAIERYYQDKMDHYADSIKLSDELKDNPNILSYDEYEIRDKDIGNGYEICLRMDLLTSLQENLRSHSIAKESVIRLGIDMCKALEACHSQGFVHRGVKPQNIFISRQSGYKLGDLEKAIKINSKDTSSEPKGESFFMPPEWYSSDCYNVTLDIYSLGMILYTLLNNNRMPFMPPYPERVNYSDLQNAKEHRFKGNKVPSPCNAGEALGEIVIKALAFRPEDRFQKAESMRSELEKVLGKAIHTTDDLVYDKECEAEKIFCPYCGTKNSALNNFCGGCGSRLHEMFIDPEDTTSFCPKCGESNLAEYRYCMKCGANLRGG